MQLSWINFDDGKWQFLHDADLSVANVSGVYVIWQPSPGPKAILIGHGNVARRLEAHRKQRRVMQYSGKLPCVTWAEVPARFQKHVESFLAYRYRPLLGRRIRDAFPMSANLPW